MKLTIADVQAAQKELCKRSLAYFAQQAWHVLEPTTELKWGWALDAICEHLQAVTDGRINRLLMNVPPGPMRWDSKVETSEGVKLLRDVQVGDMVLTHKGRYRRVSEHHDQGVLPILAIKTHSGRITHAAPSHPYLTPNGWVKAGDLNAGDVLAVVNRSEDNPLWCDPIESITEIEAAHCYCLTVEEDHSFTCSGIAVHNCMKSLLTSVIWPAWEWGPRGMPELRYVGTAHNADLAIRDTRKCRDLIKSEWYQQRWPIEIKRDQDGKTEFGNTRQGFRLAKAFTGMTGQRGDRVILDDPIGAYDANSAAALEEARLAFTETLPTRVNNEKSAIVVIMQRLNEADTSGLILGMGLPYTHLCIPMEYESSNDNGPNELGWQDPRTHDGELMFPERFSAQQVAELKQTLGPYGTAGQLQQSPSPRGGGIIKTEWFGEWQQLPPLEWLAITADTAQKTGQENDYSVLQLWGRSTTGQAVFVDQLRGKWEAPELLEKTRAFWLKSKGQYPSLRAIYIEDKASGIGLVQTLRREGVPVLPIARNAGRDKVARANDSVPFMASGNVILPAYAGWVSGFLAEVERFPKGAHDDQLDPMFDAIQLVQQIPAQQNDWATAQLPNRRYVR